MNTTVTVYRSLSNRREIATVSAGQSVAAAFPEIDFGNAAVIVNGRERNADYVLRESDVVTIRVLPSGATTVAIIALAAIAIGTGIYAGVQLYKAKKAAEEAQKELEKVKKQSNNDDIDNRPFLRGASNTSANGKTSPYVCGRHLFTPYLLGSPFYKISGEDGKDQHVFMAFACGFGGMVFDSVSIDDVRIKKFDGGEPQEGAYAIDAGIFAEDGLVEIAQDGKPFGEITHLNQKVVSSTRNDEIPRDCKVDKGDAEYLVYTLDANASSVEVAISFPYGLYAYNDEATKINTKVTISTQYSTDGGKTWETIRDHTYNRNVSSKELRFTETKGFSWDDYKRLHDHGQKNILLRVRSDGNDDPKIKNDCYVLYYQSKCFDPEKSTWPAGAVNDNKRELVPCKIVEDRERALCAIMGLRIKSTTINEDKLKKVSVISQGTARTWNGRSWSAAKSATRNPAAWALEILTSPSHPISRFSDDEIDLESFGEFYEYCESKEYRFDYVMTEGKKKGDVLNLITGNCDSTLYLDLYGRMAVATDRPQGNAIAVYNPQNIITIQNKKTFGRRTDGLRVKYVNSADDLFQEDTYLLMREVNGKPLELGYESAIKDVTVTGITEFRHVVKYARRLMATEALRPKTTTIEVGGEGVYFTPYSKILLQDDSLKIGTGSGTVKATQWENGTLRRIMLDSYVTFEKGKSYGAIVNCFGGNGATPLSLKVSGDGHTDTLTVETAVQSTAAAVPEAGCVVSFGELDGGSFTRITTPYMISGISRSDKGFRLELVNYNDAVYASGTIPDYRSNLTQKPPVSQASIPPDYVTKGEMMDAIANGIDTSAEPPDTPIMSICKAYRDYISVGFAHLAEEDRNNLKAVEWQVNKGGGWQDFSNAFAFSTRYEFTREADGYPEAEDLGWQFRCRVTNAWGNASEWSEPRPVDTSQYGTWRVSEAVDVSAEADEDGIYLSFRDRRKDARTYYGSTMFSVIVKYDGETVMTKTDVPYSMRYWFDRETDGYPERHANAAEGTRDLSLYSFTVRPVEAYTGEIGEDVSAPEVDDSRYGTWLIPPLVTEALASEHRVTLRWDMDGNAPYGKVRYDVRLGGETVAENTANKYFYHAFPENLSAEEVAALEFSVTARNEAHSRTEGFTVDASGYLGYAVGKPAVRATASRDGIAVSWERTNEFYGKCEYVLLKDGEEVFSGTRDTERFLPFGEGEFPEKSDIAKIDLRVRIDGDEESATSDAAEIDASGYLTYIPAVPNVYPSASGRSASLSWDRQDGVYGFLGCEVQVAKAYKVVGGKYAPITDGAELEWFAPALGLNPYESLENYKRGDEGGRLEVRGTSVTFSLPLFGQDGGGAVDTQYAFRLRGRSEAGKSSEWTEATYLTCRAVSAYDVTRAWDLDDKGEKVRLDGALGARQIFVEELAAISANLGFITDGALRGNEYNYWAVGDVPMGDGSTLWKGSFRVGGSDQYIQVEPRLKDGVPTGEYDITFVVGNYSVSATGTKIKGGSFEVYDESGNLMFGCSPDGSRIRVAEGRFSSTESEADVPDNGTEEVPSNDLFECPLITYDGELYFIRYGAYNKKVTTQIWKLPKDSLNSAVMHMEIKNLLYSNVASPYAAAPIASTDGKVKIPGLQRGNAGIFEINLKAKTSSFTKDSAMDGLDEFFYMNFSNNLFFVANDTLYRMTSSGSGLSSIYHYGNYQTRFCGGKVAGNNAYFLVVHNLLTMIIRIDLTTGQTSCVFLTGVVFTIVLEEEGTVPSLSISDDAISIFGPVRILGDDSSPNSPTARMTHGILRVPFSNAVWNEMTGPEMEDLIFTASTLPELYDTYIDASVSNGEKALVPISHFDALNGTYGLLIDTTAGHTVRSLVRIMPQEQAEPVSHNYYVLMGSASCQTVKDFPVADDARSEENLEYYLLGLTSKSVSQIVDGIPSYNVLALYRQAGSTSLDLRLYTSLMDEKMQITGSKVYSAGIGFSAIYHDSTSKKYRYYLDTGAYLEFGEDGRLVV